MKDARQLVVVLLQVYTATRLMMLNPSIIISQAMSWTCDQNCWKASHPCLRQWRACCREIFFGIIGCAGRNNSLSIDNCWFVTATVQSRAVFVQYWRLYCYPGAIHPFRALLLLIQICIRDRNSPLRHWGIPQVVVPVQKKSDSLLRPQVWRFVRPRDTSFSYDILWPLWL